MKRFLALIVGVFAAIPAVPAAEPLCSNASCVCQHCDAKCRCSKSIEAFAPGGPTSPAGTRATVDLPASQHLRNTGGLGPNGPGTGAGLCVFTSVEVAARWQNVRGLAGLQTWMKNKPGGGWPEKLDAMLAAFAAERGLPVPAYVQHTGGDETFLELALATGRCPCVTYAGNDDFYRGAIGHMVNLVQLDNSAAAIVDNNRPGLWIWMTRQEFLARWRGNNGGWAAVLLAAPPPPYPVAPEWLVEQCSGGSCPRSGGVPFAPVPYRVEPSPRPSDEPYRWDATASGKWQLFRGDVLFGQWEADGWHATTRAGWIAAVAAGKPPVDPPQALAAEDNFGVDNARIHAGKRWFLNGSEVDRSAAVRAFDRDLVDDAGKLNVVAVGEPGFLGRVAAAIDALDATTRGKLHVQAYGPSEWPVGQFRLAAGVTIRAPAKGRVAGDVGHLTAEAATPTAIADLVDRALHPRPEPAPAPRPAPVPTPAVSPATAPKKQHGLYLAIAAVLSTLYTFWRKS